MGKFIFKRVSHLLIPLGIIGFALKLYFGTKNVLYLLYFSIGLVLYLLLLAIIYNVQSRRVIKTQEDLMKQQERLIKQQESLIKDQERIAEELWVVQDEIFKAPSLVLKSDPFFENTEHHFSLIEINYLIKDTNGYATMHFKGTNVSEKVSDHIKIRIAGDSPIDNVSTLNLHARDKITGEEIHNEMIQEIENKKIATFHFKPHRIYFKDPIPHGGKFDIEIKYTWPGTFTRQSDYVFYILHTYKKGVDNFRSKIEFDFKPGLTRLYEIEKGKEPPISGPLAIPINQSGNSLNFEVPAPRKSLLLQWTPFFHR